jgi:colanic acid biosynthesis glycosyl transferase WcaI
MDKYVPGECLILAQYYYPEKIGSAPYCTDLAEWLARSGTKIKVVTCRPHYPRPDDFAAYQDGSHDNETINGVEILRVRAHRRATTGALSRLRGDLAFIGRVLALFLTGKIARADTAVAFVPSIFSIALARILCRRPKMIIAVVHDIESGLARGLGLLKGRRLVARLEWLERTLLNGVGSIVVLTPHMEQALRAIGVTKPMVILPIWVKGETMSPRLAAREQPLLIMYSGNLGRKQGLHVLIELSERLAAPYPDVVVVIQGSGSERKHLEQEVARRGLVNVQFRNLVPRSELMESLKCADIHLVPQDGRAADYALPSKVTSIMSAGRPIVCTAEPGTALADIVEAAGAGICVRPGDPESFFAAVVQLIESPESRRRLGENGAHYVRERLNATRILQEYERLILQNSPLVHETSQQPISS